MVSSHFKLLFLLHRLLLSSPFIFLSNAHLLLKLSLLLRSSLLLLLCLARLSLMFSHLFCLTLSLEGFANDGLLKQLEFLFLSFLSLDLLLFNPFSFDANTLLLLLNPHALLLSQ